MLNIGDLYHVNTKWLKDERNNKYIPVKHDDIITYIGIKKLRNGSERLHFLFDNKIIYYTAQPETVNYEKFTKVI